MGVLRSAVSATRRVIGEARPILTNERLITRLLVAPKSALKRLYGATRKSIAEGIEEGLAVRHARRLWKKGKRRLAVALVGGRVAGTATKYGETAIRHPVLLVSSAASVAVAKERGRIEKEVRKWRANLLEARKEKTADFYDAVRQQHRRTERQIESVKLSIEARKVKLPHPSSKPQKSVDVKRSLAAKKAVKKRRRIKGKFA